jgi:prepilin-type processing-associated H-X9-DG protein
MARRHWVRWLFVAIGGVVLVGFLIPPFQTISGVGPRHKSAWNLREIVLAIANYAETYGQFPPAVVRSKDGKPLYSWRVLILPFIEEQGLYDRFKLDEPWDSPHNKALLAEEPRLYIPPMGCPEPLYETHYQVFVGPGTAFERPGLTFRDFPDGMGNTIMVVEAREGVPWSQPSHLVYELNGPLPALTIYPKLSGSYFTEKVFGFNAAFADGSVRYLREGIDEAVLRALITRNGGEQVDVAKLR